MRVLPLLAAFVLGAGSAFLVACGGSDNLIPSGDASSIENALSQVSSDFDSGRCSAAQDAVTKLHSALLNLPDSVDSRLRTRLRQGVNNLDTRVRQTCTAAQTQTQQTQTQQTNTSTGTTDTGTTGTQTTTGTTTGTDTTGGTPPGGG
ncbi:MAG TPA: hypothetical protein VH741_06415 [Candidatus Limnocylindrales bacterium]